MKTKQWLLFLSVFTACLISTPAVADDEPKSPKAGEQAKDPFAMDLESLLDTKVITASKFSEKLSDAPGIMTVVTRDELRRFGGITLREILERVPGLSGSIASFTDRSLVAARGDQTKINGGHILFLINGRPTREILEGGLIGDLLESFPVNILERIEVIKGPGSVLYGSNAYSGVVNLITQKADKNEIVVTGTGGPGNSVATSGQAMFQRGHFSIVGAGQFHQRPDWATPDWTPLFGKINIVIPDRARGAYVGMNYKGLSFMGSYTQWNTMYMVVTAGLGRWRRGFIDLGYNLKPTDKWDMSFNVTYTRATLNAEMSIPFINRNSNDVVLEWTNVLSITDKDQLTFGALFNYIQGQENFLITNPAMVISRGSRPGEAFYGQIDHQLLDNVKLIGGVQLNKIGNIDLSAVPRIGVIWSPAPHFSVKALYSEAFRAPSINETHLHYVPPPWLGGPSLKGNLNLTPEKVATVDLGLTYQGNRFQTGVDYFHSTHTADIIVVGFTTAGRYVNSGKIAFQGVELEGKYYFQKNFFLTGSSLYQTNEGNADNTNITPIANFGAKAGISYESLNGLTAGVFDVYQGPVHGYSGSLNPRPGSYNLLNANLRFDVSRYLHAGGDTRVALVAHGENLANTAVWLPDWKNVPGDSTFSNRGRTLYFGIEVSFQTE